MNPLSINSPALKTVQDYEYRLAELTADMEILNRRTDITPAYRELMGNLLSLLQSQTIKVIKVNKTKVISMVDLQEMMDEDVTINELRIELKKLGYD